MRATRTTVLTGTCIVAAVIVGLSMIAVAPASAAPHPLAESTTQGLPDHTEPAHQAEPMRLAQQPCPGDDIANLSGPATELLGLDGVADEGTLCAWERSPLPLRADSTDAITSVRNLNLFFETAEASVPANRERLTVYQQQTAVDLTFENADGANTEQFAGADVQLAVLQQTDDASNLTAITVQDDAAGVTSLDDDGDITVSYRPDRAGNHVFVLVRVDEGNGLAVDDGTLTLDGGITVLGIESAPVQTTPSSVEPTHHVFEPGDTVTFQAASRLGGKNTKVTHAIVLYKESVFVDQMLVLSTDESAGELLNGTATLTDGTIKTSIETVNGVSRTEGEPTSSEQFLTPVRRGGLFSVGGLVEFIRTGPAIGGVDTVTTDDVTLDGSGTVVLDARTSRKLSVETFDNYSTGTYRWVHVATGPDMKTSTDTGTVKLNSPQGPPRSSAITLFPAWITAPSPMYVPTLVPS